ncbi:PREDICTED: protein phosphatase 1L [Tinamus guttatus]|nr:PREDICTED: protein phosphatase 1L [Tinamus guttatus]
MVRVLTSVVGDYGNAKAGASGTGPAVFTREGYTIEAQGFESKTNSSLSAQVNRTPPSPRRASRSKVSLPSFRLLMVQMDEGDKSDPNCFGWDRRARASAWMAVPLKPGHVWGLNLLFLQNLELRLGFLGVSWQGQASFDLPALRVVWDADIWVSRRAGDVQIPLVWVWVHGKLPKAPVVIRPLPLSLQSAAEYVKSRLPEVLKQHLQDYERDKENSVLSYQTILEQQILSIDREMLEKLTVSYDEAGTTCLIALLSDKELTVANVGDSRGVLCDKDGNAIPLSHDHKPYQLKERKRIKRAGGFISFNGSWRVQGILAMSRSLGDYPLKNLNVVIPDPDILTFDLDKLQPEFMILASDGLWDAFSNEEAVRFIKERLDEPHFGAKSIVLQSFYRGCPDNITVMVVKFRNSSKTEEQ